MADRDHYLLALGLIKGLGPVNAKNLIAYCGSPENVFRAPKAKLLRVPGVGEKTVAALQAADTLRRAETEMEFCQKQQIKVLAYLDEQYPTALKYIHDAPTVIFQKGNVRFNQQPAIAIVGTRKASDYGKQQAEFFATYFAERGINVVSGLAYGVDIAAHKAVLRVPNGITTGVLAHGLDRIYPPGHAPKAEEMQEHGGLLTEYLTGTQPDAMNFPARNRIISGMCRAIVVVEAAESGGALITARYAFDQNRDVYALPGRIGQNTSAGCNALIRDSLAKLATHPQEILDDLELVFSPSDQREEAATPALPFSLPDLPLSADEAKIINLLAAQGDQTIDQITQKTAIPTSVLNSLLLSMEFKGLVRQMPGKKFSLGKG